MTDVSGRGVRPVVRHRRTAARSRTLPFAIPHALLAAADHPGPAVWDGLLHVLLLLAAAMLCGALAERLRQSAVIGYLFAGMLVGPGLLGWVPDREEIFGIAELGVALLLFTIGLEFSPRTLLGLGRVPLLAGPLQVVASLGVAAAAGLALGRPWPESVVIGAVVSLSSTACALRLLKDRAEVDSPHGRTTLGVLLAQDLAVVPLMLVVTALAGRGTAADVATQLAASLGLAAGLVAVFYALFDRVAPRLLRTATWRRNRDLPILLAVVTALGSAWASHALGLSPALGAFAAGVLLAVSPFATSIRADVQSLKTVMVTLFFAAVGMFADAVWLVQNLFPVFGLTAAVVAGKATTVAALTWLLGHPLRTAAAAGLCLAQIGEFSFVLATIARGDGGPDALLPEPTFRALVSATILTLLLTPYLVAWAKRAGDLAERLVDRRRSRGVGTRRSPADEKSGDDSPGRILVVGFGPAGQRVAEGLLASARERLVVIDANPKNLETARLYGLATHLGDAARVEVLEHADLYRAEAVVLTLPDPATVRLLVQLIRGLAPSAKVFVRARYHVHRWQLVHAGAHLVVDEEDQVGSRLAAEVAQDLGLAAGDDA